MPDETGPARPDGMSGPGSGRPGVPLDPYRLRRALRSGRSLQIGVAVCGLLVGFLWVKLMMSSAHKTTVVLKYEGDPYFGAQHTSRYAIAPAADALWHQSVLRMIAEETGFEGSLTALEHALDYDVDLTTSTMRITVSGDTAQDAADFAGIVTGVFMEYHKQQQSRRIEAGEQKAEIARRRYNEFREEHGIADLSTEQQSMFDSAASLRADSELAVPEIRALEAEVSSLETLLASTPKTSVLGGGSSPERAAYDRLREELVNAKATLSPDHPRV